MGSITPSRSHLLLLLCADQLVCRIWELATAVKVSSNLPDKQIFGEQLHELGDLTRDLSDEVRWGKGQPFLGTHRLT